MEREYQTILEMGTDEIIEKKSRFIGYIFHVESEDEVNAYLTDIRKKHYDARHNCYAYVLEGSPMVLRFSDDGEPGGTAGKPILEVINGDGLSDVLIVVTRYFGGTLLGTGGLVRAYTQAAKACLQATTVVKKRQVFPVHIKTNYNDLGRIQYMLGNEHIGILDSNYGENVELWIEVLTTDYERIEKALIEITAGKVFIEKREAVFAIYKD